MWQPFFELSIASAMLGLEAAEVIALRTLTLMAGGAAAQREMQRMVSEKVSAAGSAGIAAAASAARGRGPEQIAADSVAHYRREVRANRQRLRGK